MKTKGLVWLGTRTRNFDDAVRFFGDTLGLHAVHEEPDFTVFKLPNGDSVEVFGPGDREHEHFDTGPVAGFLVDDVAEARVDLEAAGITFIGPVHESDDGGSWSHFTGPDGNVYEITTPAPERPRT
ncbi:MAG: VOC family protein [Rubrobacteraceae bacterium]|nr:VOC family protein [Rubrobacteraceae bacterium]